MPPRVKAVGDQRRKGLAKLAGLTGAAARCLEISDLDRGRRRPGRGYFIA